MHNRNICAAADLHHAAQIPRRNNIRRRGLQTFNFPCLELTRDLRLHQIIGARRATAQMAVFRLQDLIPHATQKVFRIGLDLLTMLQRASRMIGHSQALIW